ncbi:ester hydrolase C11orf54 homolog [Corticium candelabrum]|uniref:ester hydrolase C11orf54 homolog n=1 Tax=Corticium candelabrum TaxID=121492 RepID=UPI002E253637|nr:ester hydrolase C11orf54 homolog [Corticium candelabrum]
MTSSTSKQTVPVQKALLHVPPLEELKDVLQKTLSVNFSSVDVSLVDCPDLTAKPWSLAASGICGSSRLADVGGVPNLVPLVDREKIPFFDFDDIARQCELPGAFIIGAGAGSSRFVGVNCELMPNVKTASVTDTGHNNRTKYAKVSEEDGSCILKEYNSKEFSLLANLHLSEGRPGKVLKVDASCRTGSDNFVKVMREGLTHHYGTKPVGIGGVFVIQNSKARVHVMPKFSEKPLDTDDDVAQWLRFYDMDPPLTCLSVFISHDPGLDLRVEHTHCFSDHGKGGHYHYDIFDSQVHYTGYFTPAEFMFRIDQPAVTHTIGRD